MQTNKNTNMIRSIHFFSTRAQGGGTAKQWMVPGGAGCCLSGVIMSLLFKFLSDDSILSLYKMAFLGL